MVAVPENPILDQRVQARRQKDLDGWLQSYQDIIDNRTTAYMLEVRPAWLRIMGYLDDAIRALYAKYAVDGVLPEGRLWEEERLAILQQHTAWLMKALDGHAEKLTNNLAFQYADAYYFTAFAAEQAAKVAVAVPILSHAQVMGVIANPWLPDGFTYSDRLRANTVLLAKKMQDVVEEAISTGLSVPETVRLIEAKAGESYNNAVRLARTELNRAAAQGQSHLFIQNADVLGSKRWNATLDSRTAPKDAANDGKTYPLDYDTPENPGKPGERIPNHPNCRCKWTPQLSAFEGQQRRERIARGADDRPDNFGERTYTKAKNYREYAKERGLPDLDERLRNDKPSRYLRRGEKLAE